MERTGVVIKVEAGMATVRFERAKACARCRGCISAGENHAMAVMENTLDAEVGDRVAISLHARSLIKASLIMYGIPLLALLAGVWLGSGAGNIWAAAGGVLFAACAYIIIHMLEPRFERMSEFKPRMIDIIEDDKEE